MIASQRILFGLLVLCFMGAQQLIAGEALNFDEINKEVCNNISEEYVTCAAYFSIVSEAIRRSGDLETAERYEKLRDTALNYALITAKEGRTQEMAEKVTNARFELNVKSMLKDVNRDIGNISILINEYGG